MFIFQTGLEQSDHTPFCLARPNQQYICLTALGHGFFKAVDKQLVSRDNRDTPPGKECASGNLLRYRRYSSFCAFPLKSCNGPGMRKEEGRFFPYLGNKLIQVIRGRRAVPCLDPLCIRNVFQEPIVIVIDQLAFLPFP